MIMIEFLIMQLCIVSSYGYDCNWQLELNTEQSTIRGELDDKKVYIIFTAFKDWNSPYYLWNAIKTAMEFV